jgi:hypothetical protein
MASEHAAYVFIARGSFYRAVYGDTPPTIGESRPTKAELFKAKRAAVKKKGPTLKRRASHRLGETGPAKGGPETSKTNLASTSDI